MPNFVADSWRVTTHLSTEKAWEIHLSLRAGIKKRAGWNSGIHVATSQPFPSPLKSRLPSCWRVKISEQKPQCFPSFFSWAFLFSYLFIIVFLNLKSDLSNYNHKMDVSKMGTAGFIKHEFPFSGKFGLSHTSAFQTLPRLRRWHEPRKACKGCRGNHCNFQLPSADAGLLTQPWAPPHCHGEGSSWSRSW